MRNKKFVNPFMTMIPSDVFDQLDEENTETSEVIAVMFMAAINEMHYGCGTFVLSAKEVGDLLIEFETTKQQMNSIRNRLSAGFKS